MNNSSNSKVAAQLASAARAELAGLPAQAEACYRQILQQDPRFDPAWHALGLLAFHAGNVAMAVQCIDQAIACNDGAALYHRNLGEILRRQGRLEQAIAAGQKACALAPADLDAHYNLGLAYTDAQDYPNAIACYQAALRLDPRHGLSWNNLGSALEQVAGKDEARAAYERAVAIDPQHAEAQNNLGAIYSEQGNLDEARAAFQRAIDVRPTFVEAHYNLSSLKSYCVGDPHLAMLEKVYAGRESLSEQARIRYSFALGKALDDIGQYDRAFAAYEEGNGLQHRLLPVNEACDDAELASILAIFDEAFFASRRGWKGAADGRTPVFIVGMPRSGTTLLEQILSSHPSVHGAGELADLHQVVTEAAGSDGTRPFSGGVAMLGEADIERIGRAYLERVWKHSPGSRFITDKMPANFFYLGIIHLALPQARIIHAMRDPMDSCFSCYSRLFNSTMGFAYDQGTLGRYYVRYMTLMQHWHKVLPEGTILDLPYEDIVADTEAQARRVLEFVGLPWDENCLQFHKNERLVKTASMAQVRRPIYKTSVARWKHFARHLQPLHEIVRPWRREDGFPVLPALAPDAGALHVEGIALYRQGRLAEALECYDRALAVRPDFAEALNSRGFVLQDFGRLDEAHSCFLHAVELAPQMSMARLNLGMLQLKLGHWEAGWENYESRWTGSAEAHGGSFIRPHCPLPQWHGQGDTKDKRLLVITEQGFGDTFQFARYLAMATECFAKVGFICSQPTQRLMEWSMANRVFLSHRLPTDLAVWDLQCPLMSLPRAFGTLPDSIPADGPYLAPPTPAAAHWRERLEAAAPHRLRVGIAWAGRKAHQCDARRSLRFEQLQVLFRDSRVSWVSLQKWAPEDVRPPVPAGIAWIDWTEELTDFADTAALIAGLDLVISIDSAMVHLAGAMHCPVWMLNRYDSEWRWFHGRADSPWYPAMRIFNQPSFGDWDSVLNQVAEALTQLPVPRAMGAAVAIHAVQPPAQSSARTAASDTMSAEQALQLAAQLNAAGRLQEAEALLRRVLQAQPANAEALHLLGVLAWSVGQRPQALQLIGQAVAINGSVALFHSNLAEMNRQLGQVDAAVRHGTQAVALAPSMPSAHANLGIAYFDAHNLERAERCHRQALALEPNLSVSHNNLGSIARACKDLDTAAACYRQALAVQPDYLDALSNLAAVLLEQEQPDTAEAYVLRALDINPHYAEALCNLGLIRLKQERIAEADGLLVRSLQIRPGYPETMLGLAAVYRDQDRMEDAIALLNQCVQLHPDRAAAWCQYGALSMERGNAEEARAAYERALTIDASSSMALTGLGNLCLEQGKMEDAQRLLEQAIAIAPDDLGARFHLVQARKVSAGEANLQALEALLPRAASFSSEKAISLHYALGKAYDDLKDWDRAFPHFLEGARLKRAKLQYSARDDAARVQRLISLTSREFLDSLRGGGDPSQTPVFVLGMPRSGTTLTEQIIASHPQVHGAGELSDLIHMLHGHPSVARNSIPFPENLTSLNTVSAGAMGAEYVRRLQARAPDAPRITDKMPANYLALGLIPALLPNARIIHVMRNPVDTCLSCFTRLFNRHQDATYDLYELGQHYANYARLMQHWREVLPASTFLDVQYESIVADMEGQARRLIDWVGLPWDDVCLDFHNNTRSVRTASVTQVRQPIYTSSIERWRNYEKFLGPLLEGLGEFGPGKADSLFRVNRA